MTTHALRPKVTCTSGVCYADCACGRTYSGTSSEAAQQRVREHIARETAVKGAVA